MSRHAGVPLRASRRRLLRWTVLGLALLLFVAAGGGSAQDRASWKHAENGWLLPDLQVTPGAVAHHDLKTICLTKWGKDVRHVTQAMKIQVCRAYGAKGCPGPHYEVDHLIPRDLGGADDVKNLWPQPIQEAHQKDRLEVWARKEVCAGRRGLRTTQWAIADNWTVVYLEMVAERAP